MNTQVPSCCLCADGILGCEFAHQAIVSFWWATLARNGAKAGSALLVKQIWDHLCASALATPQLPHPAELDTCLQALHGTHAAFL